MYLIIDEFHFKKLPLQLVHRANFIAVEMSDGLYKLFKHRTISVREMEPVSFEVCLSMIRGLKRTLGEMEL